MFKLARNSSETVAEIPRFNCILFMRPLDFIHSFLRVHLILIDLYTVKPAYKNLHFFMLASPGSFYRMHDENLGF